MGKDESSARVLPGGFDTRDSRKPEGENRVKVLPNLGREVVYDVRHGWGRVMGGKVCASLSSLLGSNVLSRG